MLLLSGLIIVTTSRPRSGRWVALQHGRASDARPANRAPRLWLYVRDGGNYAVVASKGGDPKHPGWFHNLTANPDVEIPAR